MTRPLHRAPIHRATHGNNTVGIGLAIHILCRSPWVFIGHNKSKIRWSFDGPITCARCKRKAVLVEAAK